MRRLKLYATGAPSWWPYQLASMHRWQLPPRSQPFFQHVLVDNGMFGFYSRGERPTLEYWFTLLRKFIIDVERLRRPAELLVILPDWHGDPAFTVKAAVSVEARRLCRDYTCVAVAHSGVDLAGYARTAEELATLDHVSVIAAPLKIACSRRGRNRLVTNRQCQLEIARQVCGTARRHGLPCHGLGAVLSGPHLASLMTHGVVSVDSTGWTRPATTQLQRERRHSAKNSVERDLYFRSLLEKLAEHVPIEHLSSTLPNPTKHDRTTAT